MEQPPSPVVRAFVESSQEHRLVSEVCARCGSHQGEQRHHALPVLQPRQPRRAPLLRGMRVPARCAVRRVRDIERARGEVLRRLRGRAFHRAGGPPSIVRRSRRDCRVHPPGSHRGDRRNSRRRAQDGHGAVRRYQGLDRTGAGPRSRGSARDRRSGAEADDRRGPPLRRLHRAVAPATASSRCSARRSRTRIIRSARCTPRCGCRRS